MLPDEARKKEAHDNPDVPNPKPKDELEELIKSYIKESQKVRVMSFTQPDDNSGISIPELLTNRNATFYVYATSCIKNSTDEDIREQIIKESGSTLSRKNSVLKDANMKPLLPKSLFEEYGWKIGVLDSLTTDSHIDAKYSEESVQRQSVHPMGIGGHLNEKIGGEIGNLKRDKDENGNKFGRAVQKDSSVWYYICVIFKTDGFGASGLRLRDADWMKYKARKDGEEEPDDEEEQEKCEEGEESSEEEESIDDDDDWV